MRLRLIANLILGLGLALMVSGLIHLAVAVHSYVPPPQTVLVGSGCEGGSDIAVAYEEDTLPYCTRIDRHAIR